MNRAAIIIPTTGAAVVRQAIQSCLAQTHDDIQVVVVVDGAQHEADYDRGVQGIDDARLLRVVLPENVGANDYYGHRIYGGFSHLVNAHYVLFLDQDNFFEPEHVASLVAEIEKGGLDWAYALRKVVDAQGQFVARDDSESLGQWPSLGGYKLIDTNCYCLKLQTAIAVAVAWFGTWGQDRRVAEALMQNFPRFACTGFYTVNYRLKADSKGPEFFIKGGERMRLEHPGGLPWARAT